MKTSTGRSTYHHGDLKAALLQAARALLDDGGVPAVSLREVARRAGVTPAACYRHFRDKDALLVALAVEGFGTFADTLRAAAEAPDAADPLAAMGVAYVQFAVARPGLFRLMFGPAVADRGRSPDLQAVVVQATALLARGLAGVDAAAPGGDVPPAHRLAALRAWAGVHGLATLAIDGMLPGYDAVALAQALAGLQPGPSMRRTSTQAS